MLRILSLGAGVQSSTLALMAAAGEIGPMPAAAVFADTGDEPVAVYAWLDWLSQQLPFPVVHVSHNSGLPLSAAVCRVRQAKKSGNHYTKHGLPVYLKHPNGSLGMMRRYCTLDFKVTPIQRYVRAALKRDGSKRAIVLIGISRDEASRMKPAHVPWIEHQWPLVDAGMSRGDCLRWMESRGYPVPPRSACVYCPYHSDAEWLRLKTEDPVSFAAAAQFERNYQAALAQTTAIAGTPYLHRSAVNLDAVDFVAPDTRQINLFENECEGMCGV